MRVPVLHIEKNFHSSDNAVLIPYGKCAENAFIGFAFIVDQLLHAVYQRLPCAYHFHHGTVLFIDARVYLKEAPAQNFFAVQRVYVLAAVVVIFYDASAVGHYRAVKIIVYIENLFSIFCQSHRLFLFSVGAPPFSKTPASYFDSLKRKQQATLLSVL